MPRELRQSAVFSAAVEGVLARGQPVAVDRRADLRPGRMETWWTGTRWTGWLVSAVVHVILVLVLVLVVAWPMSQNGLVAIWASSARGVSSYWRYGATIAGMSWTWFLLVVLLPGIAIYGRESAGWAVAFAAQSAVIVLVVAVRRLLAQKIRSWRVAGSRDGRRLQFSIAFLLLWTAVIAMTLGLGRSALTWFGWTSEVVHWEYFTLMPVIGAYNAAYTLLALFSLASRVRLVGRIAAVVITVGALGYCQPYLLRLFSGGPVGLTTTEALVLAGSQALYLYATLLPLRLVHRRQARPDFVEDEVTGSSPQPQGPVRQLQ